MYIAVLTNGTVELRDAENFKAFKIVNEGGLEPVELGTALGGIAILSDDGAHAWVRRSALPALLSSRPTDAWSANYTRMIETARKHGWVDEATDAVRAHVVSAA